MNNLLSGNVLWPVFPHAPDFKIEVHLVSTENLGISHILVVNIKNKKSTLHPSTYKCLTVIIVSFMNCPRLFP